MQPSEQPTDPYDVPASPFRSRSTREKTASSPASVRETMARLRRAGVKAAPASSSPAQVMRAEATTSAVRQQETTPTPTKPTPRTSSRKNTPLQPEPSAVFVDEEVISDVRPSTASPKATPNAQVDEDQDFEEAEVEKLIKHRVDNAESTVEFLVQWVGGEPTWEPEAELQAHVPDLIYAYWDARGSREKVTKFNKFHVFKILKRTNPSAANKPVYLIQWVGYSRKETTREEEDLVRESAPMKLQEFEAKHGPATIATKTPTKRAGGKGPGRPRKKAKTTT